MTGRTRSYWWLGVAFAAAMPFLLLLVWEGVMATSVPAPGGPPERVAAPGRAGVHLLLAVLSAVGVVLVGVSQLLFPAFLFLDARAVRQGDAGGVPESWLWGVLGVAAVLPGMDALVPGWLPVHAINPSHSIALVAIAYLALRHRTVGVP